jgi:hypothetical protein
VASDGQAETGQSLATGCASETDEMRCQGDDGGHVEVGGYGCPAIVVLVEGVDPSGYSGDSGLLTGAH